MAGLYADPSLYDILYTPGTAAECDALERIERRYANGTLPTDRLWFEPACGTGRYLRVAHRRGRRVAGFDLDPGQIAYARAHLDVHSGQLFVADMVGFTTAFKQAGLACGSISFAFNPVNTLRHLASDAACLAHFAQMAQIMTPGGLYVVGLSLVDYRFLLPEEDTWTGRRGRCEVTQLVNYLPPEPGTARARCETVLSHLTVSRPRGQEHLDSRYDLHCWDDKQWRRLLRRAGVSRLTSCDGRGRPLGERILPYQLEVLQF